VAILRNNKEYDEVQILTLDRGHVHIRANGVLNARSGPQNAIEGEIADGTDDDPAAILKGAFRWEKGKLIQCNLESIRIRLRNTGGRIPIAGGNLVPALSRLLFLENKNPITFAGGQSKGILRLTLVGAAIEGAKFEIQKTVFTANLKSRTNNPPQLDVDLGSGNIAPATATFHLDSAKLSQPHSMNFFPGEQVSSDVIVLDNLSVQFREGKTHLIIANISLAKPSIKVKGHEDLPIVAAESYLAHDVEADSQSTQLTYSDLHSAKAYAKSDPWALANRLNGAGVFAPDVFLPIANSDLRYVKLSDLVNLYKVLGINDRSKTTITRVVIKQDNGVITRISIDTIPAEPPKDALQIEHPICVFLDKAVGGIAAGLAVEAILGDLPLAAGTTVWLKMTSPINPWIAGPSFYAAFAVSEKAVEFVKDTLGDVAGNYCEVFIAHMPNHYTIGEPDYVYHPVVFEGISVSPDRLFQDELSMRYQMYLGRAIRTSTLRNDPRYRDLKMTMSAKDSELKAVRDSTAQVRDANATKQSESAQQWDTVEAARKKEIDGYEAGNLGMSTATKYAGDQQRAQEERQREAQKRVTPGPSGQPQVPGAPPLQPPPPGSRGGGSGPGTDACGSPNCISIRARTGGPK
jgi:hypothetical protein